MIRPIFITYLLAVAMSLTGFTMEAARGAAPAVGQMTLCVGEVSVQVHVDATGAPTTAPHLCPDCIVTTLDAVLPDVAGAIASQERLIGSVPAVADPVIQTALCSYLPRAPPVLA